MLSISGLDTQHGLCYHAVSSQRISKVRKGGNDEPARQNGRPESHEETQRALGTEFSYEASGLLMCDHGPTHIDSISHLSRDPNAPSVDEIPLGHCITPAICIDVSDNNNILNWLTVFLFGPGDFFLIKKWKEKEGNQEPN